MTVCAILAVLMGLVTITLIGAIGLGRGSHNHHEQLMGLRRTIDAFKTDVRCSLEVLPRLGHFRSGPDCVILRKPGETAIYYVLGTRLVRSTWTGLCASPADVLLKDAARLTFRYDPPGPPTEATQVMLDLGLRRRLAGAYRPRTQPQPASTQPASTQAASTGTQPTAATRPASAGTQPMSAATGPTASTTLFHYPIVVRMRGPQHARP